MTGPGDGGNDATALAQDPKRVLEQAFDMGAESVSYTHLTLPTNSLV